jgi:hypothetical protein
MYMADWIAKLDDLLRLSERDVLRHAGTVAHDAAVSKARASTAGSPPRARRGGRRSRRTSRTRCGRSSSWKRGAQRRTGRGRSPDRASRRRSLRIAEDPDARPRAARTARTVRLTPRTLPSIRAGDRPAPGFHSPPAPVAPAPTLNLRRSPLRQRLGASVLPARKDPPRSGFLEVPPSSGRSRRAAAGGRTLR